MGIFRYSSLFVSIGNLASDLGDCFSMFAGHNDNTIVSEDSLEVHALTDTESGGGGGGSCGTLVTPGEDGGPSGPMQLIVLGAFLWMIRRGVLKQVGGNRNKC